MKIAVVTPYYKEPLDKLRRCHESVLAQVHPCTHIMIADGHPRPELADWSVDHIVLPFAHGDVGNTPRSIGAMSALNRGFDAVAYLDADNWLHPEHVESLVDVVQTHKVPMAFSDRFIVGLDGTFMQNGHEDDDPNFADTSCILHTMQAARMIPIWAMMDPVLGPIGDKMFVKIARAFGIPFARSDRRTMFYETNYAAHYSRNGLPLPEDPRVVDAEGIVNAYSERRCTERLGFTIALSGRGANLAS
jgi:glycosyltransferase involved in cell wall biosynthesis